MVYEVIRRPGLFGVLLCLLSFSCEAPKFKGLEEQADSGPDPGTDGGQQVLPSSCSDGVHNGNELAVDCGGGCLGCEPGLPCNTNGDCNSGVCQTGMCASPACDDSVKNGDEGDVDCGGSCPNRCADGNACAAGTDCVSQSCQNSVCQPPSCSDEIANGFESDVDCGGMDCPKCDFGATCRGHGDCESNVCDDVCVDLTCTNQLPDPGETDLDCGGARCKPCAEGKKCLESSDCATEFCNPLKVCSIPTCIDRYKNQDETGIDCGGTICEACPDGQGCEMTSDCQSGYCNPESQCSTPNCDDGWKNKQETDVDCGGPECAADCADGRACKASADCQSNYCNPLKVCSKPSCTDGWKNQGEGDIDCGAPCTTKCSLNQTCNVAADCVAPYHCGAVGTCVACPVNCVCKLEAGKEYQFCKTTLQQSQAAAICANGTQLSRIDSETENSWVKSQATTLGMGDYWLGGTLLDLECLKYRWSNGDIFFDKNCGGVSLGTFHNFAATTPTGQGCVYSNTSGVWYDAGCRETNVKKQFVCRTP